MKFLSASPAAGHVSAATLAAAFVLLLSAPAARAIGSFGKPPSAPPQVTTATNFTWADPFADDGVAKAGLDAVCTATSTFPAMLYLLHDLYDRPPLGLWTWGDALKAFFRGREYPGGWEGQDRHLHDRELVLMEMRDVPEKVRQWIEDQDDNDGEGKGLFAVYDRPDDENVQVEGLAAKVPEGLKRHEKAILENRVVIFAPGALYRILPLWVGKGSPCEATFFDLTKYGPEPRDGGVVAWPVDHVRPPRMEDRRDFKLTIKAQVLRAKTNLAWEEKTEGEETVVEKAEKDESEKVTKTTEESETHERDEL